MPNGHPVRTISGIQQLARAIEVHYAFSQRSQVIPADRGRFS